MNHPSRIVFALALSFLIGVLIASWMQISIVVVAGVAIVGLAIYGMDVRRIIVGIFCIGLSLGMYAMRNYPPPIEYRVVHEHSSIIYQKIYTVRDWFLRNLKASLPEPHSAFIAGILIGARSELPKSIIKEFQKTGTSHIIAVSGYNITIVAKALLAVLLVVFARRYAFWATIAGLVAFMIITGAQASVVRATIMGIAVLLARHVGRLPTPLYTLLIAAGIMVALDPLILRYDIGFQLSFLATFGILEVAPILEDHMQWTKRLGVWGEVFVLTLSANICVLPLILYYFKILSLVTLPVNMVILPLIPATMLVGFFSGMFHVLPVLGHIASYLTVLLSSVILAVVHFFANLPGAILYLPIGAWSVVFLYSLLGLALFREYKKNVRA